MHVYNNNISSNNNNDSAVNIPLGGSSCPLFQVKLDWGRETGGPGEKTLWVRRRTNNKLKLHVMPGPALNLHHSGGKQILSPHAYHHCSHHWAIPTPSNMYCLDVFHTFFFTVHKNYMLIHRTYIVIFQQMKTSLKFFYFLVKESNICLRALWLSGKLHKNMLTIMHSSLDTSTREFTSVIHCVYMYVDLIDHYPNETFQGQ